MSNCPVCGGQIIGDGYTSHRHCENVPYEKIEDKECDATPTYCDPEEKLED